MIEVQDKHIIAAAETNTHISFMSLQNLINVFAFTFTIQQQLHKDLIQKWCTVK